MGSSAPPLLGNTRGEGREGSYLDLEVFPHLQQDGFGILVFFLTVNPNLRTGRENQKAFSICFLPPLRSVAAALLVGAAPSVGSPTPSCRTHHVHGSSHGEVEGVEGSLVLNDGFVPVVGGGAQWERPSSCCSAQEEGSVSL